VASTRAAPVDDERLQAFQGLVVRELGAAASAALVVLGDELGLYRSLAAAGPTTAADLAQRTGTTERYVREWLLNQAAGGYVTHDAAAQRFYLTPEQSSVLAQEDSPAFLAGALQVVAALVKAEPRIREAFRTGAGMRWSDHDDALFAGWGRFFRLGYEENLLSSWIPALDGVQEKLVVGAMVGDVGCGRGASTILMARAFPKARFFGFDSHSPSIERARAAAIGAGVAGRVIFDDAGATGFPGAEYDLLTYFNCLHVMGDPVAAARHARRALSDSGSLLVVEPIAGAEFDENLNPIGRLYSAYSTLCCTPSALATGNTALGALASDAQLQDVFAAAGFTRVRRAAETSMSRVFDVRP
jgi:SAM-dependent methyltransferase